MYTFNIIAGTITTDSGVVLESNCVSGCGDGLNNPAWMTMKDMGPLPIGLYKIGPAYTHPKLGPICMDLVPNRFNDMFGRSDFRIHGFAAGQPKTSSKGCICAERDTRVFISEHLAADNTIRVIGGGNGI